jgi:hypothetical protein
MTLIEQLRTYIAPDDDMEDHGDIRALMHAAADRIWELSAALRLIADMDGMTLLGGGICAAAVLGSPQGLAAGAEVLGALEEEAWKVNRD